MVVCAVPAEREVLLYMHDHADALAKLGGQAEPPLGPHAGGQTQAQWQFHASGSREQALGIRQ